MKITRIEKLCIPKLLRTGQRLRIRYPYAHRTPLTYRTSNPAPLRTVCPINGPVLLECPDEFIPNTNVSQNRSISTDTPPLRLSDTHDTPGLIFPPTDTLSGNHPGAGNSSADEFPLRAQIIVPTLEHRLQFIFRVMLLIAMIALYLLFLPPLLLSGSLDDRCRCPCARLRRRRSYPYRRASRQAEPLPLSHISPTVLYLSVALGICCCYVTILFQLHSLSLSPLVYLSDILCSLYKYIMQQWTLRFVSQ